MICYDCYDLLRLICYDFVDASDLLGLICYDLVDFYDRYDIKGIDLLCR